MPNALNDAKLLVVTLEDAYQKSVLSFQTAHTAHEKAFAAAWKDATELQRKERSNTMYELGVARTKKNMLQQELNAAKQALAEAEMISVNQGVKKWEVYDDDLLQYYGSIFMIDLLTEYRVVYNTRTKMITLKNNVTVNYDAGDWVETISLVRIPCAEMPTVQQALNAIATAMSEQIRNL